ncbi:hypothetical protein, partial [Nocardioides sp.]|uniref:hypothetical protein n=1 Tax=Nocardioides sp. TaxID=35761 RepID=UPI002733B2AB
IHEPDTGNVLMSQRVALARVRSEPAELSTLADDAVRWWTGAPVLAHAVAAGARAAAGDLDGAAREVAMLADAGGWRGEGSYLRSVLVQDLADAAVALHDTELCALLLEDVSSLTDACGVNGAVVAFAGPFSRAAGILAFELGRLDEAGTLLDRSVTTARRLGAAVWVREGEVALGRLAAARVGVPGQGSGATQVASLRRSGAVWTVSFGEETGSLPHVKGLADLATLVSHPGRQLTALALMGGPAMVSGSAEELIDVEALRAYRDRLDALTIELNEATDDADLASVERLTDERDLLLAELRRTTGLGGRIRITANDPAERARKAVSGRIRDALRRLEAVTPSLATHLDRCVQTGLRCSYDPSRDGAVLRWELEV